MNDATQRQPTVATRTLVRESGIDYAEIGHRYLRAAELDQGRQALEITRKGREQAQSLVDLASVNPLAVDPTTVALIRVAFGIEYKTTGELFA